MKNIDIQEMVGAYRAQHAEEVREREYVKRREAEEKMARRRFTEAAAKELEPLLREAVEELPGGYLYPSYPQDKTCGWSTFKLGFEFEYRSVDSVHLYRISREVHCYYREDALGPHVVYALRPGRLGGYLLNKEDELPYNLPESRQVSDILVPIIRWAGICQAEDSV